MMKWPKAVLTRLRRLPEVFDDAPTQFVRGVFDLQGDNFLVSKTGEVQPKTPAAERSLRELDKRRARIDDLDKNTAPFFRTMHSSSLLEFTLNHYGPVQVALLLFRYHSRQPCVGSEIVQKLHMEIQKSLSLYESALVGQSQEVLEIRQLTQQRLQDLRLCHRFLLLTDAQLPKRTPTNLPEDLQQTEIVVRACDALRISRHLAIDAAESDVLTQAILNGLISDDTELLKLLQPTATAETRRQLSRAC